MKAIALKQHREKQFYPERRLENREKKKNEKKQAQFDHPNESEFGAPEYVDQYGRQYRVAFLPRLGGWLPSTAIPPRSLASLDPETQQSTLKVWIRLKRGDPARWFWSANPERISLEPVMPGLKAQEIEVRQAMRVNGRRRTGFLMVKRLQMDSFL